jgi:hypothetical protein
MHKSDTNFQSNPKQYKENESSELLENEEKEEESDIDIDSIM